MHGKLLLGKFSMTNPSAEDISSNVEVMLVFNTFIHI